MIFLEKINPPKNLFKWVFWFLGVKLTKSTFYYSNRNDSIGSNLDACRAG